MSGIGLLLAIPPLAWLAWRLSIIFLWQPTRGTIAQVSHPQAEGSESTVIVDFDDGSYIKALAPSGFRKDPQVGDEITVWTSPIGRFHRSGSVTSFLVLPAIWLVVVIGFTAVLVVTG